MCLISSSFTNNFLISGLANGEYTVVEGATGTSQLSIRIMRNNNTTAGSIPLTSTYFVDDTTDFRFQITYRTGA